MFEATISDSRMFVSIIKALALIDEGTFIANNEKVVLVEMDPAKVAMVNLDLPNEVFDRYKCDQKTVFRIDIDELRKIAKRIKSDDTVTMLLDEKENRLRIQLQGKVSRTFSISLQEVEEVEPKTPQVPFKVHIKLLPEIIKNSIMDAKIISDFVEFVADKERFIIQAESNIGEVKVEIRNDDETVLEYKVEQESKAIYPLNYLEDMLGAVPTADVLAISFSTDMPLRMEYLIPGNGRIVYYLAPRREA